MSLTPRVLGLAEAGFDPLTISHMLGITFAQVNEALLGQEVAGGEEAPGEAGTQRLWIPEAFHSFCYGLAVNDEHIYWSNYGENSISRARIDGTGVIGEPTGPDFIDPEGGAPYALALDALYVYWTTTGGFIGRAKLDGTNVESSWVETQQGENPANTGGLVVTDTHIYWGGTGFGLQSRIGRAAIDGSGVEDEWLSGLANEPYWLASDGEHLYWSVKGGSELGRVKLDGSEPEPEWLPLEKPAEGLIVQGDELYWVKPAASVIASAKLDGSALNEDAGHTVGKAYAIAADASFLYWADSSYRCIGRAPLL